MTQQEDWREFLTETIKKSDIDTIGEDKAERAKANIMVDINKVCAFYKNTTGLEDCITLLLDSGDSVIILFDYDQFKLLRTSKM